MQNLLLTAEELGNLLGVSARTIREWARSGRIPEVELSPKVRRFELREVLARFGVDSSRPDRIESGAPSGQSQDKRTNDPK
jgi:excisionase family DNA binding protein